MAERSKLGFWFQYPCAGQKPVHKVGVEGDPGISGYFFEEAANCKVMINGLQEKVADIAAGVR